jgi:hypothetical protein
MRMRHFRLMYAFACAAWLLYFSVTLLRIPVAERSPKLSAFFVCLFVVVIVPAALGYWVLFKALPWAGRQLIGRS